jgi:hypothetical protein
MLLHRCRAARRWDLLAGPDLHRRVAMQILRHADFTVAYGGLLLGSARR